MNNIYILRYLAVLLCISLFFLLNVNTSPSYQSYAMTNPSFFSLTTSPQVKNNSVSLVIDEEREKSNQLIALFQHPFSSVSDMAVDTQGNVYLCGFTSDSSFPVTEGAYDTTFAGEKDAYVMKLRADLQTIEWSTFLGGSDVDQAYSIAVDSTGCPYVAGFTDSTDFPFSAGHFFPLALPTSYPFISRLSSTGDHLMYSSSYEDIPYSIVTDIVLDEKEDLYATGKIAIKYNEETGVFLMKLRPACDYEVLFTSIQECYIVFPHLAIDFEGNSYIASYTWDYENPVTADAFQKEKQPPNHAQSGYLMKLNAAGDEILYATYLGGSNRDWIYDIAVDKNQCVYVTGKTHSWDYPVTSNAYDAEQNLQGEAFFTVINTASDGNAQVEVSSYFGGSGYDTGSAIQVDTEGRIYIGGTTNSPDLPTTPSAYQKIFCKNSEDQYSNDGFFCVFDSTGSTLFYSTYLGGEYSDTLHNMQLFSNNEVYLQGSTRSSDFLHPEKESSEVSNMYILILEPFKEPVAE